MSQKLARGTKRVCPSCASKFYDLNRSPIICPICKSVYQVSGAARPVNGGNALDTEDDAVIDSGRGGVEFVSMDEVQASEGEDLPEIEGGNLADAADEDATLDTGDEEPFLETEDEGEADVSPYVGGGGDEEG